MHETLSFTTELYNAVIGDYVFPIIHIHIVLNKPFFSEIMYIMYINYGIDMFLHRDNAQCHTSPNISIWLMKYSTDINKIDYSSHILLITSNYVFERDVHYSTNMWQAWLACSYNYFLDHGVKSNISPSGIMKSEFSVGIHCSIRHGTKTDLCVI